MNKGWSAVVSDEMCLCGAAVLPSLPEQTSLRTPAPLTTPAQTASRPQVQPAVGNTMRILWSILLASQDRAVTWRLQTSVPSIPRKGPMRDTVSCACRWPAKRWRRKEAAAPERR